MSEKPAQPDHDKPYWTVARIAKRHDTSEKKVRREIKRGNLIAHRFGGQVRVSPSDLLTYERVRRQA